MIFTSFSQESDCSWWNKNKLHVELQINCAWTNLGPGWKLLLFAS